MKKAVGLKMWLDLEEFLPSLRKPLVQFPAQHRPGVVVHPSNPSTPRGKAGVSEVKVILKLHTDFESLF